LRFKVLSILETKYMYTFFYIGINYIKMIRIYSQYKIKSGDQTYL